MMSLVRDRARFNEKYGDGAYEQLLTDLSDPHLSYAEIGRKIGVSDRSILFWRHDLGLTIGDGHERRRTRTEIARRAKGQEMLQGCYVSRMFSRIVAEYCPEVPVEPIPRDTGKVFRVRTQAMMMDGRKVLLLQASRIRSKDKSYKGHVYYITKPKERSDFVFYLLRSDFLFVPVDALTFQRRSSFHDTTRSRYARYRNNFDALNDGYSAATQH